MAAAADDAGLADGELETQGRLAGQGIEIDRLAAMTGDHVGES
ncbi:MAG TPA: hypothetical protein VKB42_15735 [Dongiaceae bacterium]|nr:hypothetical protein [Dongiaceae bacterium]